jgi:hypothetical protein
MSTAAIVRRCSDSKALNGLEPPPLKWSDLKYVFTTATTIHGAVGCGSRVEILHGYWI